MSVVSVSISEHHTFSKTCKSSITLLTGVGVKDDCHAGKTTQHRYQLRIRPAPPNLRQVHLMQSELFQEFLVPDLNGKSFNVKPGQLGENITTVGIDLLELSRDTKLHFVPPTDAVVHKTAASIKDDHPVIKVTGLRSPCSQIDSFQRGLKERCLIRDAGRTIVGRKSGIMAVVENGGEIVPGSKIVIDSPLEFIALEVV